MNKTRIIPAGTVLYHGTDAHEDFTLPKGPAWFAWTWDEAAKWAGWGSEARGKRRVIQAKLKADAVVCDTEICADWRDLCDELCDDPDATPWEMARAVKERKLGGWYGRAEVLLVNVRTLLEHVEMTDVPDSIIPWGR